MSHVTDSTAEERLARARQNVILAAQAGTTATLLAWIDELERAAIEEAQRGEGPKDLRDAIAAWQDHDALWFSDPQSPHACPLMRCPSLLCQQAARDVNALFKPAAAVPAEVAEGEDLECANCGRLFRAVVEAARRIGRQG